MPNLRAFAHSAIGNAAGACVLAIVALLCGCGHKRAASTAPRTPTVATVVAREGVLQRSVSLSGLIAPYLEVALSDTLAEPTLAVYVNEGDPVREGEVLARLSAADLQGQLENASHTAESDLAKAEQTAYSARYTRAQLRDQVSQDRAQVAQALHNLASARRDLERDRGLLGQGYVSLQSAQLQQTTVLNDEAALRSAQALLRAAVTNVNVNGTPQRGLQASAVEAASQQHLAQLGTSEQLRAQIDKATIVSPIDGVVVNRNLNPGEYPTGRQIFTLEEISRVYAVLNASATQVSSIHNGARVYLSVNGKQLAGQVRAILDQVTPGATNYTVKALFENPQQALRPGVPVVATVALDLLHGVEIPDTAFIGDDHQAVLSVEHGVLHRVAVSESADNGTTAIVGGLKAGTRIVVDGTTALDPGQHVAVH